MTPHQGMPTIFRGLTVGIVGVLAVAIAPILLTRLFETGRLSAEGIGIAICVEFIAMALGSMIGARLLGRGHTGLRLTLVCLGMAAANLMTPLAAGPLILLSRALAGGFGGMMIWVVLTTIIRSAAPERWSGLYLSAHTAVQFAVAALIAAAIVPRFGAAGGYGLLAAVALALIPVALAMPDIRPLAPAPDGPVAQGSAAPIPASGWLLLGSILLLNGFFSSLISYAEVAFQARGFAVEQTLAIVPVILLAQILGGLVAAALAARLPQAAVVLATSAVLAAVVWGLEQPLDMSMAYVGFAVFGFCWLFVGPVQLGLLLRRSGTPRAGEFLPAAQLLGLALGPLLAAAVLTPGGYPPAAYHLALIAGSVALLLAACVGPARPRAAHGAPG